MIFRVKSGRIPIDIVCKGLVFVSIDVSNKSMLMTVLQNVWFTPVGVDPDFLPTDQLVLKFYLLFFQIMI